MNTGKSGEKAKRLLSSESVVLSWISSEWFIVIIPALERLITRTSSKARFCRAWQTHLNLISFRAYVRVISTNIQLKWMALWTDLYNPLHGSGYCLHPEFHAYNHTTRTKALTDLYTMWDKIHGEGSARLSCTGNIYTRQRKAQCSQETTHGQMQQRWVRRNCMKCMSGPFIVSCH